MKLKAAHMGAGGRKWCAQRQQSRIMQMLGNELPVKHKKEAIFQSLRCLGEKIRTSGLLNPIQKISFAFYAVFCLYFRISPDKCDDILNNHPYKGKLDHVLTTHINF